MHVDDDRLIAEIDGLKQFRQLLCVVEVLRITVLSHRFHIVEVGASTKTLAVAFEDNDANVVAAVEPVEGFGQFAYHFGIQCVAHLRAVEVDPCHAFAQLYFYCVEIHCYQLFS